MSLKWEYCECGCHCMVAKAGPLNFSILKNSQGEWLRFGHRDYPGIRYDTWNEAKAAAEKVVRDQIEEMQKALGEKT